MSVNNGQRVAVVMPGFEGEAGYVSREDRDEICFEAPLNSVGVRAGVVIMVAGQDRTVVSIAPSSFLRGFLVLELNK